MKAKPVLKLEESVARKIAAGEVIDRPNSLVRELIDNSIDAKASRIDLSIEEGGIGKIRIVDDGQGMSAQDLKLCCLPHATSKIRNEDDLLHIRSMGFRGEALSSIAASARLDIISSQGGETNRLTIRDGKLTDPKPWRGQRGTIIEASDLFYSIPARRKFLKRPSAEATMCKKTFIEKSLPFPHIHFQFSVDGKVKLLLPPSSLKQRVANAFSTNCPLNMLQERQCVEEGFDITIIAARPELNRKDRKMIQIFANNRRIDDFAFIQAVQYGYDEFLPGGVFPLCFVFINVDPALVDFNIHPAKREARFRNGGQIHHELVSLIKDFLQEFKVDFSPKEPLTSSQISLDIPLATPPKEAPAFLAKKRENYRDYFEKTKYQQGSAEKPKQMYPATHQAQAEQFAKLVKQTPPLRQGLQPKEPSIHYLGQIMGVFLVAEIDNSLYLVDMHAAHERILFEKYANEPPQVQELLIPKSFEVSLEEAHFMEAHKELFKSLGIEFKQKDKNLYDLMTIPRSAQSREDKIIDFVKCRKGSPAELKKELYATMSCRNAIKEGDPIDPHAALNLLRGALSLENPRCPHGRLLWFKLSKDELYGLVGRHI